MSAQFEDIKEIARGKERGLLIAAGISESVLNGKNQPCPMCGGRDRFRYTNFNNDGLYICSQCGKGNWIDLLKFQLSTDFIGVVEFVKKNLGVVNMEQPKQVNHGVNRARLDKIQAGCRKITKGDPVDLYLTNRGLSVRPDFDISYNPSVAYWEEVNGEMTKTGEHPAMIAGLRTNDVDYVTKNGFTVYKRASYKVTFLTTDGHKANVKIQKKLMPPERDISGSAVRMFKASDTIAVAEGIETALAYYQDTGIPSWSCDCASNLERFVPPEGVKNVVIIADDDESFTGYASAFILAKRLKAKGINVNVVGILEGFGDGYHVFTGKKMDYLDYFNTKVLTD